jgi:hypothetical protein
MALGTATSQFIDATAASIAKFVGQTAVGGVAAAGLAEAATLEAGTVNPQLQNALTNPATLTTFPSDIPSVNGQLFCMLFQFYRYVRPSILISPTLQPLSAIALPIPNDLVDTNSEVYDQVTSGAAIGAALESFGQGAAAIATAIAAGTTQDVAAGGANTISPGLFQKGLAFAGVTQNPYLSMLFQTPSFKRFRYSWLLLPQNKTEAENLNLILNTLRYNMMPDVSPSAGGTLLTYPSLVLPTILPTGYVMDWKLCVIESMSVNYVVGDQVAFNPLGQPNCIQLTLQILEIELWFRSDIATAFGGNATPSFGVGTPTNSPFGTRPYGSAA